MICASTNYTLISVKYTISTERHRGPTAPPFPQEKCKVLGQRLGFFNEHLDTYSACAVHIRNFNFQCRKSCHYWHYFHFTSRPTDPTYQAVGLAQETYCQVEVAGRILVIRMSKTIEFSAKCLLPEAFDHALTFMHYRCALYVQPISCNIIT